MITGASQAARVAAPTENPRNLRKSRRLVVLPVMAFYALSSNLLYACIGAALRQWLATGRRLLWFNRGMAALLVLTALWMLRA